MMVPVVRKKKMIGMLLDQEPWKYSTVVTSGLRKKKLDQVSEVEKKQSRTNQKRNGS